MEKISYAGYRFPPEIIDQAIWLYLRFTLNLRDVEDLLAERGVAVSYETVRRWVNHFGPMIAADLRKRRQKPHTTWHLDEVHLKIDGRMAHSVAGCRRRRRGPRCARPIQAKQARRAEVDAQAFEKNMPSSPSDWSQTICDHTAPRSETLGSNAGMNAGDGRTIERRIRINRRGGGSARCSGSRARVQPRNSCQRMPPSTTSPTSNVISLQPERTARFALWRWTQGGPPSQRPDNP